MSVSICPVEASHEVAFLDAVRRSKSLIESWAAPPDSPEAFARHLEKYGTDRCYSFLAKADDDSLIGCINLNEIVRGAFQSAYLGYYAFVPNQGKGLMRATLSSVIYLAFTALDLHRLEANVQPANSRSLRLVTSLGFRLEGFSVRYLNVGGEWKDHARYAITREEWRVDSNSH